MGNGKWEMGNIKNVNKYLTHTLFYASIIFNIFNNTTQNKECDFKASFLLFSMGLGECRREFTCINSIKKILYP